MSDLSLKPSVRDATPADIPAITAIYAHWVRHGLASFEYEPPSETEMALRQQGVMKGGYPYLVAVDEVGGVLGYAYATAYRTRMAYRFAVEDSIYVAPGTQRRHVGVALMERLIERCTAQGYRLMVAVIGDSGNAASIGMHRACGFQPAGVLPSIGWKHGRWVDSVLMTRPLGAGDSTAPEG